MGVLLISICDTNQYKKVTFTTRWVTPTGTKGWVLIPVGVTGTKRPSGLPYLDPVLALGPIIHSEIFVGDR